MKKKLTRTDGMQCSGEYWMSNLPQEVTERPLICIAIPGFCLLIEKYYVLNF